MFALGDSVMRQKTWRFPEHTDLRTSTGCRGMACIGMFEVHAYDSWLTPAGRQTNFFGSSQFSGTLPAPLFIFLAGLATALITDRMRRKGASPNQIATRIIRRGAEIYCLGFLFRLQEFVLGWPNAPRTDLLRVDVLNMIGLSIMLLGILCRLSSSRKINGITAAVVALSISLAAPLVWTTWRPHWLPWYLESYFDGVHIYGKPQSWLFPLFPWSAFAFAGLAVGCILTSEWSAKNAARTISMFAAAGIAIFLLSWGSELAAESTSLSCLRLLAHESEFLSGASRNHPRGYMARFCMVRLGSGDSWLQPSDSTDKPLYWFIGCTTNSFTEDFQSWINMRKASRWPRRACW